MFIGFSFLNRVVATWENCSTTVKLPYNHNFKVFTWPCCLKSTWLPSDMTLDALTHPFSTCEDVCFSASDLHFLLLWLLGWIDKLWEGHSHRVSNLDLSWVINFIVISLNIFQFDNLNNHHWIPKSHGNCYMEKGLGEPMGLWTLDQ